MKRSVVLLIAAALSLACHPAKGEFSVADEGQWPESWPKELEPLRKQAKTYEGPRRPDRLYLIPFTKREEFEAAWPHLLKVKSKGAPIILVHGPKTDFFKVEPAGVMIKSPPVGQEREVGGQERGNSNADVRTRWMNATYIELVVDGQIVDLNRIELPQDTPVVDERFKK